MKLSGRLICMFLFVSSLFAQTHQQFPQITTNHIEPEELFNKDVASFMFNGEFLYWNVFEGALDYAIRMKTRSWGPSASYAQGTMERAEFDWSPGFRLALGYYRAPNFWELVAEYTYLHFSGFNHVKHPPLGEERFINGTFPQIFPGPMSYANSRIHLHYEAAHLAVNRVFYPFDNPHLRLRLIGALTSVFLHQGWRVRYFDLTDNVTSIWNHWQYWGLGFRSGIGFDWYWGASMYMSGKFTLALVTGHYKNHAKQETTYTPLPGDDPSIPIRDIRCNDYRISMNTQFLLGPSFQQSFPKWRIEIFGGYEFNIWTNLQEVLRSTQSTSQEDKQTWVNTGPIGLQGLTARLTINF